MRLIFVRVFIALNLIAFESFAEELPKKVALVIGNSIYSSLVQLPNAARDAETVGAALEAAGFSVEIKTDATAEDIEGALKRFEARVQKLPASGMGLIYFAGHGFEVDGVDVIAAKDARFGVDGVAAAGLVPLSRLVSVSDKSVNKAAYILVVDACRKLLELNQAGFSVNGLSQRNLSGNAAIFYSTQQFRRAADGAAGELSPFADSFVRELREKSEPWPLFVANVTRAVSEITVPSQVPEIRSGLTFTGKINDQPVDTGQAIYYQAMLNFSVWDRDKIDGALRQAANKYGNVDAMLRLGYWNMSVGKSAPQYTASVQAAEEWFLKAAKQGSGEGWHRIGELRLREGDEDGAIKAFEKGAELGNSESNYHLGAIYGAEASPRRNMEKAVEFYSKNLYAANCCSAVNLARIYYMGSGVKADKDRAAYLYRIAAERGNVKGWTGLGFIYKDQGRYKEAIDALRHGEEVKEPQALNLLGTIYADIKPYVDLKRALQYFKAAEAAALENGAAAEDIQLYRENQSMTIGRMPNF